VRLLLDQDVYETTARFLIDLRHDVVRVAELGMAQASDEENLKKALDLNRIFVTRDRDYGNIETDAHHVRAKRIVSDEIKWEE